MWLTVKKSQYKPKGVYIFQSGQFNIIIWGNNTHLHTNN